VYWGFRSVALVRKVLGPSNHGRGPSFRAPFLRSPPTSQCVGLGWPHTNDHLGRLASVAVLIVPLLSYSLSSFGVFRPLLTRVILS